jgi:TonB-like protein
VDSLRFLAPAVITAVLPGLSEATADPSAGLCAERLRQTEAIGRTYEPRKTQMEHAVAAAKTCAAEIETVTDPVRRASLRAKLVRAQVLGECWDDAAKTFEAMVAASSDDPRLLGAHAAALDRAGRPGETEAILARAEQRGAGFGRAARFAFIRERFDPREADRFQPMIDGLRFEETDRTRLMLLDLWNEALVNRGEGVVLAFLAVVDSGAFKAGELERIWSTIIGPTSRGHNPWMGTIDLFGGGDVEKPVKEQAPKLEIPDGLREKRKPARADAIVRIEADGSVRTVWVLRATDPLMEEAAAKAARTGRWIPAKRNGEAVPYPFYQRFDVRFN